MKWPRRRAHSGLGVFLLPENLGGSISLQNPCQNSALGLFTITSHLKRRKIRPQHDKHLARHAIVLPPRPELPAEPALDVFGKLPAELRARIWGFLALKNQFHLTDSTGSGQYNNQVVVAPPRRLRAIRFGSSKLRDEITPYLDATMYLKFEGRDKPKLSLLPDTILHRLKRVVLRRWPNQSFDLSCPHQLQHLLVGTAFLTTPLQCPGLSNKEAFQRARTYARRYIQDHQYAIKTSTQHTITGCVQVARGGNLDDLVFIIDLVRSRLLLGFSAPPGTGRETRLSWMKVVESNYETGRINIWRPLTLPRNQVILPSMVH